jgi:hypothetical protein
MNKRFKIVLLDEVFDFLQSLEHSHYEKILYNGNFHSWIYQKT